jgi:hypothetical protein
MSRHTEQLPHEVVRDRLGIARALYASRRAAGVTTEELAKLADAGALFVTRSTWPKNSARHREPSRRVGQS